VRNALVVLCLGISSCSPRPPLTPAEKQDLVDYYNAICSVNPSDEYEKQICSLPMAEHLKGQKLKAYRQEKISP